MRERSQPAPHFPPVAFPGTPTGEPTQPGEPNLIGPGPFQYLCAHGHDPTVLNELLRNAYMEGYWTGIELGTEMGEDTGERRASHRYGVLGGDTRFKAGWDAGRATGYEDGIQRYNVAKQRAQEFQKDPVPAPTTVPPASQTTPDAPDPALIRPAPPPSSSPVQFTASGPLVAHVTVRPPTPPSRDLSALRSDKQPIIRPPFGSLKRRARRRFQAHRPSPSSRHPHLVATLDWDRDPRLSDLARALTGLGWVRAH